MFNWKFKERLQAGTDLLASEQPLRSEIFSIDQLQQHAERLAAQHQLSGRRAANLLLPRLSENEKALRAYNEATALVEKNRRITPAAEWLLDNFYLIEEQIRTARRHLPRGYSRELPHLTGGPSAGYPRVYDLALELIVHVDGRVDAPHLSSFVAAYQRVTPLKLGELWAIPIMLRLALIENLRRVAVLLSAGRKERDAADRWADRMLDTAEKTPAKLIVVVAEMAQAEIALTRAFVAEFYRRLQEKTPTLQLATSWIEQRLAEDNLTIEQLVQSESQNQAANQVTVGNSITSLRFLDAMDWREFVETLSVVEQTLRTDPSGVYSNMDFATRDAYRHAVERISKYSRFTEGEVAQKAIDLTARNSSTRNNPRAAHVGFFLIGKGALDLEQALNMQRSARKIIGQLVHRFPLPIYLGAIVALTVVFTVVLLDPVRATGMPDWSLALFSLLPALCVSHLAISFVNWFVPVFVPPRLLPRMDFSEAIPPEYSTMVVIPTMLTNMESVGHLIEGIEIRYLANRDPQLYFALLTDFRDAPQETLPDDEPLLRAAREGIAALNEKYKSDRSSVFFLFHRPRRWNPQEGVWMGHERKRGKITEFNKFLRGSGRSFFSDVVGDTSTLPQIRHVITLDTDTQLPREAARQLVGTIAHPLNRPRYDPARKRVTEGYGILQPRVEVALLSASRSLFVKLFSGEPGLDPYTRAVSDVYQDLFQEGSFIGKGIYDVDTFAQAVGERFPENRILSHDLLESAYARSALVSDVQLYEEYPSQYPADVSRRHRWIRGDWQIATWLLPRVPGPDLRRVASALSGLSRWKIFDNLRRSLVPGAFTLLLVLSWTLPALSAGYWELFVLASIALPLLLSVLTELARKPKELPWLIHLRGMGKPIIRQMGQAVFIFVFLPHEAFISLDAVLRSSVRLLFTRRHLLEWQTASETERKGQTQLAAFCKSMWSAPAFSLALGISLSVVREDNFVRALPWLCIWFMSPLIAWWISRPLRPARAKLDSAQLQFLHNVARKTWRYFETFVGPEENWLPPDNFQEYPTPVIATRTSPTNIGMCLLSNLSAYDFGYIPAPVLLERTASTLDVIEKLDRYRGHFFNWYDTRSLRPLLPLYVSTVDNGNLAGHVLILQEGLKEISDQKVFDLSVVEGLRTTLRILLAQTRMSKASSAAQVAAEGFVALEDLEKRAQEQPTTLCAARTMLQRVLQSATKLKDAAGQSNDSELQWWSNAWEQDCRRHLEELEFIAPWASILAEDLQESRRFQEICQPLDLIPTLRGVARIPQSILPAIELLIAGSNPSISPTLRKSFNELKRLCLLASERAGERMGLIERLAARLAELAEMDFTFLYDPSRDLFAIGFNVSHHRMDSSFYDLLASEARLTSFVTIALGQLKQEHWFALGRLLTSQGGMPALISWSGSMFEYLMPLLVMPTYDNTLLDASYKGAVARQIEYGRQRGVPWGFSESGYNLTDVQMTYQYRAFGVPGLGFKRGLAEDLVVAPYASVLALMVVPEAACENLERLAADHRLGRYGFYEAIDYTPSRLPPNQSSVTVESFMAHHQGMSLLALGYVLLDRPMQRRFENNPFFRAAELLLQERVPKETSILYPHELEATGARRTEPAYEATMRVFTNPDLGPPEAHLLSNGRYHLMVTSAGGGYSRWKELALTRWREDSTRDCWGIFLYLRNAVTGEFWSVTHQPTVRLHQHYEAIFSQGRAEFRTRYHDIDAHSELCVSPEDDLEVRRVTLTNRSELTLTLELTSYAEVVLNTPAADDAHPAFSNLFVQTQILPDRKAILCTRRPRSSHDQLPWMVHLMLLQGTEAGEASFETDRAKFLGRDRTPGAPAALTLTKPPAPLSNSNGSVLDPIVSIRRTIRLAPGETARISLIIGLTPTRDGAMGLVEKYQDQSLADRVIELAWTHSLVVLRHLGATEPDAQLYGRMASALIYTSQQRRANASILSQNRRGQSSLWSYGISGDLPILLVRNSNPQRIDLVRQVLQAHSYWRLKGLAVDLVILNEVESVYRQSLHDQIMGMISSGMEAHLIDKPGGIFVRRLDQVSQEDRTLLQTVARVYLFDENGTLAEQLARRGRPEPLIPTLTPVRSRPAESREEMRLPYRELIFFNGLGGFTLDGREYVVLLAPDQTTPAPWVNVLANAQFGSVISEIGSSYTWSENSHEFRLTPWYNDPVSDVSGEAFYIRDEQTGRFWSPTPYPARGATPYTTRHGFGYSVFEHLEYGIASEFFVYVAVDAPVKFAVLKLKNHSERVRQLSVAGYWEWVLGELRQKNALHVVTEIDPATGALFARNPYNTDYQDRIAFVDVNVAARTVTADRTEFLGRNRSPANPASMGRARLSGKVGAGLDPCAALQAWFELGRGEEREIVFLMGVGTDREKAQQLIQRFRGAGRSREALEAVWRYWGRTLGMVHFETPDPALNVLANGWLVYQVLACRLWGRTGFYQSGGAYGFRDQLQDVMALVQAEPGLFREHLLRCASHQFLEGDVQHWWHPPRNRGVRTHFSDDYLWLPFAACYYVQRTRDTGVLDERIPFLEGRPVRPEEEAYYDLPQRSGETATLYEHCVRAIQHGLRFGEHGLPLIGCGDWNDGMNRVGEHGKGESVWLAFFLYEVLNRFSELARERNDPEFADRCAKAATTLQENIERHAWDGQWYRRAYFDNGEPLGSASNPECQIDSLPQSWSILSGAGDPERSRMAMDAVDDRLVRRDWKLIQLFDPPFDSSHLEPGYIKGYVPGVRENGGQYTHAAVWTTMAFALMGDHERAWELFTLINPVRHGDTVAKIARYKVEPYVVAADVYGAAPHISRGGWTWYTGSAGWMYRLILEIFLGVTREGNRLRLAPRLPERWKSARVHYRYFETIYHITITREAGQRSQQTLTLDGTEQPDTSFPLVDDRKDHQAILRLI